MKKRFAVFDIDGTIFRSSLLIEVTEALINEGLFPASARKFYAQSFKRWLDRRGSYEEYILDVIKAFDHNVTRLYEKDFRRVAREVVNFHKDRVYRYTRDLVRDLDKRGYYLLAISHSPVELVREFGEKLGFDKVYGRIHETDSNGRFTGATMYLDLINDKAKILKRAVKKENLTMKGSIGVGDTYSDAKFLRLVENPICFNPNIWLFKRAKRSGWKIVVERKDVIYEF